MEKIRTNIKIFQKNKFVCLSIDTRKSDVMIKSLNYGVDLINDVSGFNYDNKSLTKLKKYKVPKVIHHIKGHQIPCRLIRNIKMSY